MNLPKAIEILTLSTQEREVNELHDFQEAVKLGTEALKHVQQIRAYAKDLYLPLLPGETV